MEQLRALAQGILSEDSGVRDGATQALSQLMSGPECVMIFLEALSTPEAPVRKFALTYLPTAIKLHGEKLNVEQKAACFHTVVQAALSAADEEFLTSVVLTLSEFVRLFKRSWDEVLDAVILPCWSSQKGLQALMLLNQAASNLSEQCVAARSQEIAAIIEFGFQSDWTEKVVAANVFFEVLRVWNGKVDVGKYWQKVVEMTGATDVPNPDVLVMLWKGVQEPIERELVSDEVLGVLYSHAIAFASCTSLSAERRYVPMLAIMSLILKSDGVKFTQIAEVTLRIAHDYVDEEEMQGRDFLAPLAMSFQRLPGDEIYSVLKPMITTFFQGDLPAHVVAINVIEILLVHAPETAYKDSEFLLGTLLAELDRQSSLIAEAVCWAVNVFDQSYGSILVYIPRFLPKLVPFLVSPDSELRTAASDALHGLVQQIDSHVDGLFKAFWDIKDNIPQEEFVGFADFLASAIEKSTDFGDAEMETLVDFVMQYLTQSGSDCIRASEILHIVSAIVTHTDSLAERLDPVVIPVVDAFFSQLDKVEIVQAVDPVLMYIECMFKVFGPGAQERYGKYVEPVATLALNEVPDTPDSILISAFSVCCSIAKVTKNVELAVRMQERCSLNLDIDEDSVLTESLEATCDIAKLLPPQEAKQLFLILVEFINDNSDPSICSSAMKPLEKMLAASGDENKAFFLQQGYSLVSKFLEGGLACMNGVKPTEGKCDHHLLTAVLSLITKIVRTPSEHVDKLCMFTLSLLKSPNSAATFSVIGVCSEAVKYGTCSKGIVEQLLSLSQSLMADTKDPDVRQNITYLMNIIIQKVPELMATVTQFVPLIWTWFEEGQANPIGNQLLVSNVASFILQFAASGGQLANESQLILSIGQLPPYDIQETVPMIGNLRAILSAGGQSLDVLKQSALAVSKVLLLNEGDKEEHHVTGEVMGTLVEMLKQLVQQNGEIATFIQEQYANSKMNLAKLTKYMQ